MDIGSLDFEAQESALRQVSQMLQRPDQLEKLEQFKKKTTRKKAALEAMLKTAVQSQLEGVRVGLSQLQTAAEEVKTAGECMDDVFEALKTFAPLKEKLKKLKDESEKYSQCAAAMENLKTIYEIQSNIDKTYELIGDGKLLHAHKYLSEMEIARDDVMYEVFKLQKQSEYDLNVLKAYFSELDKLSSELGKQLWYIVGRTLQAVRGSDPGPQNLVTALRIIEREERNDHFCVERHKSTQFLPPGRPRKWKQKCFDVLENLVQQRIEGNQLSDRSTNKQWLAQYLEICRRIICEDLVIVRRGCTSCFPPEYNIYEKFVYMYHKRMSARLVEITQDKLEKNELIQLLGWVRTYSGNEMLGHSSFHIDIHKLLSDDPLIPSRTYQELVDRFREVTQSDLHEWLEKTLTQEKDEWYDEKKPEEDNSKCYYTALPSILYGMIEDQVKLAKEISVDVIPSVMLVCVDEMIEFTQRYKDAVQAFKMKHFEDRSRFRSFAQSLVAVANNCLICVDSTDRLKTLMRLTVETDKVLSTSSPTAGLTRASSIDSTLDDHSGRQAPMRLSSVASQRQQLLQKIDQLNEKWQSDNQLALNFLLEEVYVDLAPHLADILTKKWFRNPRTFETICMTLEDYYCDHGRLKQQLFISLLMSFQCRILHEYFKAMENRRISFANYEERNECAEQLKQEAEQLRRLLERLQKNVPQSDMFEMLTDVLVSAAEVLSLSDKSLLPLVISSFIRKFPDVGVEQLAGLAQLREDTGRSEARQLAQEVSDQNRFRTKSEGAIVRVFSGL